MNPEELSNRFLDFAVSILKIEKIVGNSFASKHIFKQLVRSATSSGANYQEARSAESKADFVHKLQIVLKESRESYYWLKLLQRTDRLNEDLSVNLILEINELISILIKSIKTAKSKQ
ncbi:MAG: four helix bundle protein [Candidatus Marinimicrobia bacterium]|nr:four helix bundle protein [Candidatus Neomarinimicrobiota bacterium]